MSSLKYFTGDLFAHNEDLPNTYVKSSPHLTIFYSSNLILVGSCTWHCYTKSVIEQSLSLGLVARKFWFPADIHLSVNYQIRKSYLKIIFHDTTRKHDTLGLQRGWTLWENNFILQKSVLEDKTGPFWCTGSLGLRQVQSILTLEN